ncbi:pectate lyase-like protein [Hydrogenispora ethanolica]|uniref:Pectate lyase-like protein n=1 Tax=Hydrogenispora ethanolica TaxID=1082276 RepID=A0A4R1QZ96_HYDET|nr:glycosyl hydrolase family 28-related protein [Hydrogenispora ethanolica]TCL58315.1 pectate lyase-like protein [Hydrogenispora ethanolica]
MNLQRGVTLILIVLLCGAAPLLALARPGLAADQPILGPAFQKAETAPVNVKTFGARGDGVSDDSASIQRALASLKDGGALFFPKGQYAFTRTLTIPSNVRIFGDSKRSAVLLYLGTDRAIVSGERTGKYGVGSYYLTIEDITLRGVYDAGTGLYITSRYLTVNNAEISHFDTGVDAQFCWTNKFYNVSFFYHNNVAFKGGSFLNANSFVNCIFSTGQRAVSFTQGSNVSFVGCQFEGYTDACFSFNEVSKNAIWNLNISGCYFENRGKVLDAGANCSLAGLTLSNNLITVTGSGLAIQINNADGYGKNSGVVENNSFLRNNNDSTEAFVHLEGLALIMFRNNQAFAAPSYAATPLLDEATRSGHGSSLEENPAEGNLLNVSGVGAFQKGVLIGGTLPADPAAGLLIYDNGKLRLYQESGRFEYVQTAKAGPSSERPQDPFVGMIYFDTTLSRPLWWTGSGWVDAGGAKQ